MIALLLCLENKLLMRNCCIGSAAFDAVLVSVAHGAAFLSRLGAREARVVGLARGGKRGLFDCQEAGDEVQCQVSAGPGRAADYHGARGVWCVGLELSHS